jgi:hypothetical protein
MNVRDALGGVDAAFPRRSDAISVKTESGCAYTETGDA